MSPKKSVYLVILLLASNIALTVCSFMELNTKLSKTIESTATPDPELMQHLKAIEAQGLQQRTILMQRTLGLEHVHGMHQGVKSSMCPGCQQDQDPPSRDSITVAP